MKKYDDLKQSARKILLEGAFNIVRGLYQDLADARAKDVEKKMAVFQPSNFNLQPGLHDFEKWTAQDRDSISAVLATQMIESIETNPKRKQLLREYLEHRNS